MDSTPGQQEDRIAHKPAAFSTQVRAKAKTTKLITEQIEALLMAAHWDHLSLIGMSKVGGRVIHLGSS